MDYDFYNPYLLNKLDTIDAEELMATPYAPKNFIVADMLPEGLTLLCGPSKIGKSWFVLQLCLCVALGRMFLGHNIISSDVLYLALEDTEAFPCRTRCAKSCLLGVRCKSETARSAETATT